MELKDCQGMFFSCGIGRNDQLGCLNGYEVIKDVVEHIQSYLSPSDFQRFPAKLFHNFCYTSHSLAFSFDTVGGTTLHSLQPLVSSCVWQTVMQVLLFHPQSYQGLVGHCFDFRGECGDSSSVKLRVLLALAANLSTCLFQVRSNDSSTPRQLAVSTVLRAWAWMVQSMSMSFLFLFLITCILWHLKG